MTRSRDHVDRSMLNPVVRGECDNFVGTRVSAATLTMEGQPPIALDGVTLDLVALLVERAAVLNGIRQASARLDWSDDGASLRLVEVPLGKRKRAA